MNKVNKRVEDYLASMKKEREDLEYMVQQIELQHRLIPPLLEKGVMILDQLKKELGIVDEDN